VCEICEKEEQRIKRLSFNGNHLNSIKLKGASIRKEREKAEKALLINGC
jgi:hypothetical protein